MNKYVFLKTTLVAFLQAGCWAVWWVFVISIFVGGKENENENI